MDIRDLNRRQQESEVDPDTPLRYRHFSKAIPPGAKTLLDVGSNTGRGGLVLKERAPDLRLFGLELLEERAERVPAGVYEKVEVGLLDSYVPPVAGFDMVVMGEVIEHVPFPSLDAFVSDVLRVLRPGGLLALTTPNPHWIGLKRYSGGSVLGGAHVSVHCPAALAQYLEYRGFAVESVRGTGTVAKYFGQHLPLALYGAYILVARAPTADARSALPESLGRDP